MTIRKSEAVDSVGVGAISNRIKCRLEIAGVVPGQPAQQAILRGCRLEILARSGDGPGVGRPAAVERVPRRMCVLCGLES